MCRVSTLPVRYDLRWESGILVWVGAVEVEREKRRKSAIQGAKADGYWKRKPLIAVRFWKGHSHARWGGERRHGGRGR